MMGYRAGGGFFPCGYHYWKCFDGHILAPSVGTLTVVVLMVQSSCRSEPYHLPPTDIKWCHSIYGVQMYCLGDKKPLCTKVLSVPMLYLGKLSCR